MYVEFVLKEYYIRYLRDIRKIKESSIKHYIDALNSISRYLIYKNKIKKSIFEISEINELELLRAYLYSDIEFKDLNKRGHQMYSSGLNNYYKFANGDGFRKDKKQLEILDIQAPTKGKQRLEKNVWKRSSIIKKQVIEYNSYLCEVNPLHMTFIVESTKKQYMEGHHIIPFCSQNQFKNSLDIYANIICLCPICHRFLHYGLKEEKMRILESIYSERADRLEHSGIKVSKREFVDIVI